MLLVDVTFYLQHVQKLVFNVSRKNVKNENNRDWGLEGDLDPRP